MGGGGVGSERFLRSLLYSLPVAVTVVDRTGRVLWGAEQFRRVFGFPADDRYPDGTASRVHPDDLASLAEVALSGGASRYRLLDGAGRYRWVEVQCIDRRTDPDVGGIVVVHRDVDDQVRSEVERAQAQARSRQIIEMFADGVAELDSAGRVVVADARLELLCGAAPGGLLGLRWGELVSVAEHPVERLPEAVLASSLVGPLECHLRRRDGGRVHALVWVRRVAADGPGGQRWAVVFSELRRGRALSTLLEEAHARTEAAVAHLGQVVGAMGEGLVELDATGTIRFVNPRLAEMVGVPSSELVGHSWVSLIDPSDAARAYGRVARRPMRAGDQLSYRARLRVGGLHATGGGVDVQVRATAFDAPDGLQIVVVFSDISELVKTQGALADALGRSLASEAQQRQVADQLGEGLVASDRSGVVLYANPAACELFGFADGGLVGRAWPAVLASCATLTGTGPAGIGGDGGDVAVLRLTGGDGSERVVRERTTWCHGTTGTFAMHLYTDVTALEEARRLAAAESRAKSEFVARVAHELRNPLQPVMALADALDGPPVGESELAEYAAVVRSAGAAMLRLVEDLNDLERLSLGVAAVGCERVPVLAVCRRVAERARFAVPDVPVAVSGADVDAAADAARVDQVVSGLVANAQRYARTPVDVVVADVADRVVVDVVDRGPGIAPELRERAFAPFERLGRGGGSGSGLGLTIARDLVAAMGGTIELGDTPGGGLTVSVTLPAWPLPG